MSETMPFPLLPMETAASAKRTPTVYFIDDSATMREVIKIAFRRENITVITAGNAASAIAQFEQTPPDAVINKINRRGPPRFGCSSLRQNNCVAHWASLSANSSEPVRSVSSNSRIASSIRSVAERSTVRCAEAAP